MKISKFRTALVVALLNGLEWLRGSGRTHHQGERVGVKNDAVSTQQFMLEVSVDDGTTWVEVSQITDIVDPTGESADLDASNLKSRKKEYIAGLSDSASVNITGQRVAADVGQNILRDNQGIVAMFRNTYGDGEILNYTATIKSFRVTGSTDQVMMFSCAIRGSDSVWTT